MDGSEPEPDAFASDVDAPDAVRCGSAPLPAAAALAWAALDPVSDGSDPPPCASASRKSNSSFGAMR